MSAPDAPRPAPSASAPRRHSPTCVVVAIDGTAGAGKSTTAKAVADRLGFRHLDSGAIYRAVALRLLDAGLELDAVAHERVAANHERDAGLQPDAVEHEPAAAAHEPTATNHEPAATNQEPAAANHKPSAADQVAQTDLDALRLRVKWRGRSMEVWAAGKRIPNLELRTERVTAAVSPVSSVPAVREHLLALQRSAAQGPGLVAEGRDMGTVVFPDAQVKVFLVADARERARRRLLQNGQAAPSAERIEAEAARLRRRDDQDSSRRTAPLVAAPDAVRIDTTRLSPREQVAQIVQLVVEA